MSDAEIRRFVESRLRSAIAPAYRAGHTSDLDDDEPPLDAPIFDATRYDHYIIEYISVSGSRTTRVVALHGERDGQIFCHCYTRQAMRSFHRRRIQAVFDLDGIQLHPPPFPIGDESLISESVILSDEPAHISYRPTVFADVVLLRIIATSDGYAHRKENDVICDYAYQKMVAAGLPPGAEPRRLIRAWIAGLRPDPSLVDHLTMHLSRKPDQEVIALLAACRDVIKSDGRVDSAEISAFEAFATTLTSYRAGLRTNQSANTSGNNAASTARAVWREE